MRDCTLLVRSPEKGAGRPQENAGPVACNRPSAKEFSPRTCSDGTIAAYACAIDSQPALAASGDRRQVEQKNWDRRAAFAEYVNQENRL
jgi:hypothetical protein